MQYHRLTNRGRTLAACKSRSNRFVVREISYQGIRETAYRTSGDLSHHSRLPCLLCSLSYSREKIGQDFSSLKENELFFSFSVFYYVSFLLSSFSSFGFRLVINGKELYVTDLCSFMLKCLTPYQTGIILKMIYVVSNKREFNYSIKFCNLIHLPVFFFEKYFYVTKNKKMILYRINLSFYFVFRFSIKSVIEIKQKYILHLLLSFQRFIALFFISIHSFIAIHSYVSKHLANSDKFGYYFYI